MASDDRIPRKPTLNMAKAISYLKKSSLKVGLHSSRYDHETPKVMPFNFEIT